MIGGNNEPYDIYVTSSDIDVLHNNFTTAIAVFDKCGQCSETIVVVINDHFYCFGGKSSALPFNYTFILCFIIVLLVMSLVIFSFLHFKSVRSRMELELQEVVVKPVPHTSTMADHHDVHHDTTDCEKGKSQESNLKTDTDSIQVARYH